MEMEGRWEVGRMGADGSKGGAMMEGDGDEVRGWAQVGSRQDGGTGDWILGIGVDGRQWGWERMAARVGERRVRAAGHVVPQRVGGSSGRYPQERTVGLFS